VNKKLFCNTLLDFGLLLLLLPITVRADFILEFTDGRKVTVGRYVEEGQTIKIYNALGAISFRKADVKRITEIDAKQSANTRLETVSTKSSSSASSLSSPQGSAPASLESKEAPGAVGTASDETKVEKVVEGRKAVEAERERIDEEYKEVSTQMRTVWNKSLRDTEAGAPLEVQIENGRRLSELNQQRGQLIDAARKANPPDQIPDWAQ
jgi:hypothetical protein